MKKMLILMLSLNFTACNLLDAIEGSTSTSSDSSVSDSSSSSDGSASTDSFDEYLADDESSESIESEDESSEDESSDTDEESEGSSDEDEVADTSDDESTDEESTDDESTDDESTEEEETEVAEEEIVPECILSDFFYGQLELCGGERLSYLYEDGQGQQQSVLLSDFQIFPQSLNVTTSIYYKNRGQFVRFPSDHDSLGGITIGLPANIPAKGQPGNGRDLILKINDNIACVYHSAQNAYYGTPVCYEEVEFELDDSFDVVGARQIPADVIAGVNSVRAHIRSAEGVRTLTTAEIVLSIISESTADEE